MVHSSALRPCGNCLHGRFNPVALLPGKRAWITVNRALAWALIVSPLVQIALRVSLPSGLLLDLGLVVLHGALSLALFCLPPAPKGTGWMLWLGFKPRGMGARGDFLMTGWRIALPLMSLPLSAVIGGWVLALPSSWLWLRLPFTTLGHIGAACVYAIRRWRLPSEHAELMKLLLPMLFIAVSTANLLKGA